MRKSEHPALDHQTVAQRIGDINRAMANLLDRQQGDIFAAPVLATPTAQLKGMVRGTDAIECQAAAVSVLGKVEELQARILELLTAKPMTDKELEALPEFAKYEYSTVRKRRSELSGMQKLTVIGRRGRCRVWAVRLEVQDG